MSFVYSAHLAPASIDAALSGGTVNDWNPTGWGTATIIWITASAPTTVNGLASGTDGRIAILMLRVGSSDVTLASEAAGSTAANRFNFLAAGTLSLGGTNPPGKALQWNSGESRWNPFSGS